MLLKYLISYAGRHSYSVGKVFIQHIKAQQGGKPLRYFHLDSGCVFGKAVIHDVSANVSINESFNLCIKNAKEKPNQPTRKRVLKRKVVDEILEYLNNSCSTEVLNTIPGKCLRRNKKNTDQLYLVIPEIADTIVRSIKDNIVKEGVVVLETNPGLCVLSRKLIEAGVQQLHLHESSILFKKVQKNFHNLHSDRVNLYSTDFLSLWKIQYQDKMDAGTRVQDILSPYLKKNWTEEPSLKIIGCIQSSNFIKHLIFSIVFQNGIMAHCRPELYFVLPPTLFQILTCTGKDGYLRYRSMSVLFQMFFDCELLEKLPRKAYLPWSMPVSTKKRKLDEIALLNEEWMYLTKIVPKRDLYETIPAEKLPALWYFVRHHFWSRSDKLIREMESWIPGCGVRLILEGYNVFTEFGDLKPSEVFDVFQLFSKWPEYKDSSFLSSLETALLKLEENSSDNLQIENDDEDNEVKKDDR